jgi:hypothetical protein
MSRLTQIQNIDKLILSIDFIIENRCSFSEKDFLILNEVKVHLQFLKRRKGKTNKDILKSVVKVVELLSTFFVEKKD